jgi:hypothetical protein
VGKGEQLARQLFDTYQPQILVIEPMEVPGSRRSPHLPAVTKAIEALARQRGITVVEYTPAERRTVLASPGVRLTMAHLCQALAGHYPVLTRYLLKLRRGIGDTEPYYTVLFKAVALGLTWATKQRQRR